MDSLSDEQTLFVEEMGLFTERRGYNRSAGRVLAVLLISEEPLTQENLMHLLDLSRTSTSVSLRWAEQLGWVRRACAPGERKYYYEVRPDVADWMIRASFQQFEAGLRVFNMATYAAEPGARDRVQQVAEIFRIIMESTEGALQDWLDRNAGHIQEASVASMQRQETAATN